MESDALDAVAMETVECPDVATETVDCIDGTDAADTIHTIDRMDSIDTMDTIVPMADDPFLQEELPIFDTKLDADTDKQMSMIGGDATEAAENQIVVERPPSTDTLENIAASVATMQQSASVQPTRPAAGAPARQIAIAPKPVGMANKSGLGSIKKIALTGYRQASLLGKTSTILDSSGRHIVVVPTTNGRIKVIGTASTQSSAERPQQAIRTAAPQVIQLRQQSDATPPPLSKIAPITGETANVETAAKPTTTRYLSLQQAQQMGLVSGGKIQQLLNVSPVKQTMTSPNSLVKPVIKQNVATLKTPTKILPAPPKGSTGNVGKMILTSVPLQPQNVTLKSPPVAKASQILKLDNVTASGNTIVASLPSGQKISSQKIHQINVPGKGIQYVRLVNASPNQISKITQNAPVRIAPLTTVSSQTTTKTLQMTSKIVPTTGLMQSVKMGSGAPSKSAQVLTKPLMLDLQGNILHIVPSDGQNVTPPGGISFKQVISQSQAKLVPKTITITSPIQKAIQSTSSMLSPNALQVKCKEEIPVGPESPLVPVEKTEAMEEEDVHNEDYGADSSMDETNLKDTSSSSQSDMKHVVMVPASYIQQIQEENAYKSMSLAANVDVKQIETKTIDCALEFGMRPRKPCNCTKSQCLKLYCDCFANGEFCNMCNCNNCFNNLANEEFRHKAIKTCLERNPNAFRPKIGKAKNYGLEIIRRHNKGCNCKRSGCLKNYCECYEGKIACSANCKCIGCRNVEDVIDKRSIRKSRNDVLLQKINKTEEILQEQDLPFDISSRIENVKKETPHKIKKPWRNMTTDVIEGVCTCLIAQATESERQDPANATRCVLEEFSRCLEDMINTRRIFPSISSDMQSSPM